MIELIIDTHVHLTMTHYKNDLDKVIKNANNNNVMKMIAVGMDRFHNLKVLEIAKLYPNVVYPTVGVHPTSVEDNNWEDIITYLDNEKIYAVGEIGIDLHWRTDNLLKQQIFFEEQIKLAIKYNLPIIIHTRNSFNEAYEIVKKYKGKVKGVFHCFSSSLVDAKKAIELGFLIGIGGPVTFKNATELHKLVKEIDLSHIVVETDAPYLAPMPYRGMRNEPAYTKYVVEEISKIKNIDVKEVMDITTKNAINLFKLEDRKWKILRK